VCGVAHWASSKGKGANSLAVLPDDAAATQQEALQEELNARIAAFAEERVAAEGDRAEVGARSTRAPAAKPTGTAQHENAILRTQAELNAMEQRAQGAHGACSAPARASECTSRSAHSERQSGGR
jgi:hypothetical protein